MSRQLKSVKSNPLASRIKKVMQADEDVGKIAQGAPVLVSRAVEMFLTNLCEGTAGIVSDSSSRTATPSHLKAYVTSAQKLDFLADKFTAVPDLVEDDMIKEAPVKKQRGTGEQAKINDKTLSSPPSSGGRSSRGRGRTRGRGSVRISAQDTRAGQDKSEPDAAELDAAMPDVPLQHIKQESLNTHQQPDVPVKAEDSSAQEHLLQAAVLQPYSQLAASPSTARAEPEQLAQSSLGHGQAAEQQVTAAATGHSQMHDTAEDLLPSAASTSQASTLHSITSAGAFNLPRTSLDVLPEEDDYDADE